MIMMVITRAGGGGGGEGSGKRRGNYKPLRVRSFLAIGMAACLISPISLVSVDPM
jgi:hypothetical protein